MLAALRTGRSAAGTNYSLKVGGKSSSPLVPASLVILSMQLGNGSAGSELDLFVQHMVTANASLDAFLSSDAVGDKAVGTGAPCFNPTEPLLACGREINRKDRPTAHIVYIWYTCIWS